MAGVQANNSPAKIWIIDRQAVHPLLLSFPGIGFAYCMESPLWHYGLLLVGADCFIGDDHFLCIIVGDHDLPLYLNTLFKKHISTYR